MMLFVFTFCCIIITDSDVDFPTLTKTRIYAVTRSGYAQAPPDQRENMMMVIITETLLLLQFLNDTKEFTKDQ